MVKKRYITIIVVTILFVIIIFSIDNVYAAATPTLVTKLNTALKKILEYLKKLSTPATGVAIASGVLIRKLSFGDEEKMIIGKKVIVNAILGYIVIQLIDLIIKFIEGLV